MKLGYIVTTSTALTIVCAFIIFIVDSKYLNDVAWGVLPGAAFFCVVSTFAYLGKKHIGKGS